jgi:hypothetical protein
MTFKPASIRDSNFRRIAVASSPFSALERMACRGIAVAQIDLYQSRVSIDAQVGICWTDGSTYITDADSWASLTVWNVRMIEQGYYTADKVHIHG